MYRIINKVFFVIVVIISVIISVVFSIGLGGIVATIARDADIAATVTIISLISLATIETVSFSMWGMIIETADKVDKLYRDKEKTESANPYVQKSPTVQNKQVVVKEHEEFWFCEKCGTKNTWTASFCKDCGKYK